MALLKGEQMQTLRKQLLNTEEVALKLGKPVSWVYNNIKQEGIPHIKLGQQYRFLEDEIDSWILRKIQGFSA
jgi:excisionase family DNA binding protein